jgi:hypothetical protein
MKLKKIFLDDIRSVDMVYDKAMVYDIGCIFFARACLTLVSVTRVKIRKIYSRFMHKGVYYPRLAQ